MDSTKRSAVTPSKSKWSQAFAKFFHVQPVTGVSPDYAIHKTKKSDEKKKKDLSKNPQMNEEDEEVKRKAIEEAFIAKMFASILSIKAAYARLQYGESPYDTEGIQSSEQIIVSELKKLSEMKQCYLKNQLNDDKSLSPESTLALAEIQEQKSLIRMHEITCKKLESQLKLKDSEMTFLKEKLAEVIKENKTLKRRLNSSGQFPVPDNTQLNTLKPAHFIAYYSWAMRSITRFVRLLTSEMESAKWDFDKAADSIEPGIYFWKSNHKCFAFESYVCRVMFEGFNFPSFSIQTKPKNQRLFFDRFMELKSVTPEDYIAWKPKSEFATFCRVKYLKLVHPSMELSLFGDLNQRNMVNLDEIPETPFFALFIEMAKRVWLLHCLAFSYDPEVSIFRVSKGSRFSEVYMESLSDEAFISSSASQNDPRVAFNVAPGFKVGDTIIQCKVYLC